MALFNSNAKKIAPILAVVIFAALAWCACAEIANLDEFVFDENADAGDGGDG